MVITIGKFFSFFSLALLGMEFEVRDIERDGVLFEEDAVHLPGFYVCEESMVLRRVRQNRDILSHSVRTTLHDPEVQEWLKKLGGLRKLDTLLLGEDEIRAHLSDLKFLRDQLGYVPSPLGEPGFIESDSATDNSGYAVEAHRTLKNRERFGEVDFDEEEDTVPNWALTEFDFDLKTTKDGAPWWWKKVAIGKFNPTILPKVQKLARGFIGPPNRVYPKVSLSQIETGGPIWRPDLRISPLAGDWKFTQVNHVIPDFMFETHPLTKEFIDRFYNNPYSLLWFYTGYNGYIRHACAMRIASGPKEGQYIWCPLTTKSSATKTWWENWEREGGKDEVLKYSRALYVRDWIIAYRKVDKTTIEVRGFKESGSDGLMLLSMKEMHFSYWGRTKARLIAEGAIDAYFGKPWKLYEAPARIREESKPIDYIDAWNSL